MNPEEQRIKIAEACGHKFEKFMCNPPRLINPAIQLSEIPDYLNDLNAMHEAEKVLDGLDCFPNPRLVYYDNLRDVCRNPEPTNCWSASAAQRAEAFLKTLGLWKP